MSRPRFVVLLLLLGTLVIYLPAAHYGFSLYDDSDYVSANPVVQSGLTWHGFVWAFGWHACNWHPLTWLSLMADCQFFGPNNAGAQHTTNVLLHAANTVLLLFLLLRWTNALWPSAFVTALFAWHPIHVESVAWIAERKDVLSAFFALLALLAYTRFVHESRTQNSKPRVFYILALVWFALGLMAKPMVVTLPFVLLLLDYWPFKRMGVADFAFRNFMRLLVEKLPFFLLTAASCVVTFMAQHRGGAVASLETIPLDYRLVNLPVAYAGYLAKMFWPAHLAIFYPLILPTPLELAAALGTLLGVSWLVWRARRSHPYCLVGWLWFLGMLVPVIGLVQVGGAAMADRYTYLPSIGIFLAVTLLVHDAARRFYPPQTAVSAAAVLVLAACLVLTHRQLGYWKSDVALFRHALQVTRDNDTAHLNLGYALQEDGHPNEALVQYRLAAQINPFRAEVYNNIANLLDDNGHPREAIAAFQKALRLKPGFVAAHNNYGTVLAEHGRFAEAMKQYTESEKLNPADWHAPYLMGKVFLKEGHDAEAVTCFQRAIRLEPDNPQVLTYLAQVLASDENPSVRNGNAALAMAAKANDLTGGVQPAMIDAMGMAYAQLGQFTNAQQSAAYALKLATAFGMTNDVVLIRHRLQLYKEHRPFRQSFLYTNTPAGKTE